MSDKGAKKSVVLVIEDDQGQTEAIAEAFRNGGDSSVQEILLEQDLRIPEDVQVITKDSVGGAIDWLNSVQPAHTGSSQANPCPDLVLLDLQIKDHGGKLPSDPKRLPGYDVLQHIRVALKNRLQFDIPVVILSDNISTEDPARSHGFHQFCELLNKREFRPPDDLLAKNWIGAGGRTKIAYLDPRHLFGKTARFLIDLDENDIRILEKHGIHVDEEKTSSRFVLQQLKRIARSASWQKVQSELHSHLEPLPDVLLLGPNGVGKSTFAKAYHLLRQKPSRSSDDQFRLAFLHEDLGSLDTAGASPAIRLFGATRFSSGENKATWTLGSFAATTYYSRPLAGQVQEDWKDGPPEPGSFSPVPGQIRSETYPNQRSPVNYGRSGTLFLDEVANIDPAIRKMLLQALTYNRKERFVVTTGSEVRRVPVSPAIIMATRKDLRDFEEDDNRQDAALDYLFRIDQMRVVIPSLSERRSEIIPYLKNALCRRRNEPNLKVDVDPPVEILLANTLTLPNNFADLERIVDQVTPEETSISFRHIRPLFERDFPIVVKTQEAWTYEQCAEYLDKVEVGSEPPRTLSEIKSRFKIGHAETLYHIVLTFLHRSGYAKGSPWPSDSRCQRIFKQNARTIQRWTQRYRREFRSDDGSTESDVKDFSLGGS